MYSYPAGNNSQFSWRKASFCAANQCVEVAVWRGMLIVRGAEKSSGPMLSYTTRQWQAFIHEIKAGRFDSIS